MDEKKEKILIAARRVFARKGYHPATIKEIAAEAGVAGGLLHYHFKNKEDLLIQAMISIYENSLGPSVLDQLGARTPEEMARLLAFVLRDALRNAPEFFQLIYGTLNIIRQSETVRERMEAIWRQYRETSEAAIRNLKKTGAVRSPLASRDIVSLLVSAVHGIGIQVVGEPSLKLLESDSLWQAIEFNLSCILGKTATD